MSLMQDQIEALRQAMSEKSGDYNMHQKPCAKDDINRMAETAGFPARRAFSDLSDLYPRLERFAALVAAAERELIARSMDKQADLACDYLDRKWAQEMAAAIRARGEK